ncbi:hypothetical protein [Parvibaculum sp.]|uniref:hypothetical protein n=1 Tax=Parvibaculum sp. TaxID=2024848 RepID=UPI00320F96E6
MTRQDGVILIVVLLAVAALSVVVVLAMSSVHQGALLSRSSRSEFLTGRMARSAVEITAARLLTTAPAARWRADGSIRRIDFDGEAVSIRVTDATALLDVNRADIEIIRRVLLSLTDDRAEADAIARRIDEWRGMLVPTKESNSAAVGFNNTGTKNLNPEHPFRTVNQLAGLFADDMPLFERALPLLTIYGGGDGRLNPWISPPALLGAIPDISPLEVDVLLKARNRDGWNDADAAAILKKYARWMSASMSGIYVVDMADRTPMRRVATIILQDDMQKPFNILSWSW